MERKFVTALILSTIFIFSVFFSVQAQELKTIKLADPIKKGGLSVMEAMSKRASVRNWVDKDLSQQDLSDLLWAADGINRPDSKKRTAPSAGNAQDVDIYVFMKSGVFVYDAVNHSLNPIAAGDHRSEVGMSMSGPPPGAQAGMPGGAPAGGQAGAPPGGQAGMPSGAPAGGGQGGSAPGAPPGGGQAGMPGGAPASGQGSSAPINLVLVSDLSKFPFGTQETKTQYASIDIGIVSQNIAIFCAAKGMGTRPIAGVNKEGLKTLLKLKDTQQIFLEQPVGYIAETK
jgi:nitroreductase